MRVLDVVDQLVGAWNGRRRVPSPLPPVSAVISASVFDTSYLAVTLPHLLEQTRFSFAERLVVVDPRPATRAHRRGRGRPADLDRILTEAKAAGVIDRVIELDTSEAARRQILERYFGADVDLSTDPAIYATLFGLESARHSMVAWFDPDLLFHADGDGWATVGLHALLRDRRMWVATTRGGRPSAPPVALRWPLDLRRASLRRARTFSSRHFLCDRRRLHGKLRDIPDGDPAACITAALEHHRAFVGIVHDSWHLHPRLHAPPFPHWIDKLVDAVARGDIPDVQRDGCLRLDHPRSRGAWRRHLFGSDEPTAPHVEADASPTRRVATLIERRAVPGSAPISIIIPIRNRCGPDVRKALASLTWQTVGRPWETIIVSHGSEPDVDAELHRLAIAAGATLITVGTPTDAWCKPLALNTGILATDPAIAFVMTMDADMILAENMLETVVDELRGDPDKVVLCQSSDLPDDCSVPDDPETLRAQFELLRQRANVRGTFGTGGIQALRRSFLFDVRGYDEDMLWWGALDTDLVRRAEASGLRTSWVTERTAMLHQPHPKKHRVLPEPGQKDAAQSSWLRNHEIMVERASDVVRNRSGWGASIRISDSR